MRKLLLIILLIIPTFSVFSQETILKLYRAYGEAEPIFIKKEVQGNCWQQSHYVKREDAWRCQAENVVYDPCFIKPFSNKKEAICTPSPWNNESIKINLLATVDSSNHHTLDMSRTYPWALELVDGEKCQAIEAEQMHEGQIIRYQCTNQTFLFGALQRCKMPWTILQRKDNNQVETVSISKAWF